MPKNTIKAKMIVRELHVTTQPNSFEIRLVSTGRFNRQNVMKLLKSGLTNIANVTIETGK